jgi:hypothetical protein
MITRSDTLRRVKLHIAELERCINGSIGQSTADEDDRTRIAEMLSRTLKALEARERLLERQ